MNYYIKRVDVYLYTQIYDQLNNYGSGFACTRITFGDG